MIDEDYIVDKICAQYPDFIVKPKRGSTEDIYASDIFYALLIEKSGPKAAILLSIGEQTFNRSIKKIFPGITLNGGGQTWLAHILHIAEVYKCTNCGEYKHYDNYYNNKSRCTGIDHACTECRTDARNKEYHREYTKNHYYSNKSYYIFKSVTYKARKTQRVPVWADLREIELFYYNRPLGYHVDHIIPLNGRNVSGLHVINNLQYLTAEDNLKKSNKFEIS